MLARQYSLSSPQRVARSHIGGIAVHSTEAASLRGNHGYKTPDAIQLATAQAGHATFFVTNDEALGSLAGLQVVVLKHVLVQP